MTATLIGLDVGGTAVKWAVTRGTTVIDSGQVATPRDGGESLVAVVGDLARNLSPDAAAVGLAVPGLVDTTSRHSLFIPNIPGEWSGYPLGSEVERRSGRPVSLLNDARAFGYAELLVGAGRAHPDAVFIVLGTGVGGAIAKGGQILIGGVDSMGEMGHVVVQANGARCGCGGRGCLETVASATALVASLARATMVSMSPTLDALTGGDIAALTTEVIAQAASVGDPWSIEAFDTMGRYLGAAAGTACVLMQLSTVIIGGGLGAAFPHFAPALRATLAERRSVIGDISVLPAEYGSGAGAVGAALYAAHAHGIDLSASPTEKAVNSDLD